MRNPPLKSHNALTAEDVSGWIDVTAVSSHHGKEPADWFCQSGVVAYLVELSIALGGPNLRNELSAAMSSRTGTAASRSGMRRLAKRTGLVFTKLGRPEYGAGTWAHPRLGPVLARWLSPEFAVRCDLDSNYASTRAPAVLEQLHREVCGGDGCDA